MQGYGNYEELTLSGVNPTELFDDIKNKRTSADSDNAADKRDGVTKETNKEPERKLQLLQRKCDELIYSESRHNDSETSLYPAPSVSSLLSIRDDIRIGNKVYYYDISVNCV